jgi:hypothetical protein
MNTFPTFRCDFLRAVALRSDDEVVTFPGNPLANWGLSVLDRKHAISRKLVEFLRAPP